MTVIELIATEGKGERTKSLVIATLAGVTSAGALTIVNMVAQAPGTATIRSFLLFVTVACISLIAARRTAHWTNTVIESAVHRIKTRLVGKIERANLEQFERIGSTTILDRITESVSVISNTSSAIGSILQALCRLIFSVVYLISISPVAFAILFSLQIIAIRVYGPRRQFADQVVKEHAVIRIQFLGTLIHLLRGATEIRLNRARSRDVLDDFRSSAGNLKDASVTANRIYYDNGLFLTTNLYLLLATLVFVLPKHMTMDTTLLSKLVATVLFIWGSVETWLSAYISYVRSNEALDNIRTIEEMLDQAAKSSNEEEVQVDAWNAQPGRIEALGIQYAYPSAFGDRPFGIGPIDLSIEPGEIVFIVGGNGSGKSTLLKVLTGLYPPHQGVVQAGGVPVLPNNASSYREMIATIFSDFHLFSRAYGLLDADPETVGSLLRQFQIDHKTKFQNGEFTRQRLSTGQRKRLAMILALLEDRPVFVLDEWAADQDPEFRKYFYQHLLPSLKRKGKTVIAVSHDDRYFHCADRVVSMEYGLIRTIRTIRTNLRDDRFPKAEEQIQ